ncbi:hypothetical protein L6164_023655 [Bauhinia variegata]|uniref:Uncharacterized protein n=1 Tax=Bauhinia variegata TaxID=167791 RepID=A0ACB9MME3_BAUVA|nr:hypothetical protein L6164_023655 [Bauhinia variegata]
MEITKHLHIEEKASKLYKENSRVYNAMFAFTSIGAKVDKLINSGRTPWVYRTHGQKKAKERFDFNECENVTIKLLCDRNTDGRSYNLPTLSEVAALIISDFGSATIDKDILFMNFILLTSHFNPLLFPYREDGYRTGMMHRDISMSVAPKRNNDN